MKIYADHELHKRDTAHRYDKDELAVTLKWLRCGRGEGQERAAESLDLEFSTYKALESGTVGIAHYGQLTIDKILRKHQCETLQDLYAKAEGASLKFQHHELFGLVCKSFRERQTPKWSQDALAATLKVADGQLIYAYETGRKFRKPDHIVEDLRKLGFKSMQEFIEAAQFDVNSEQAHARMLLAQANENKKSRVSAARA